MTGAVRCHPCLLPVAQAQGSRAQHPSPHPAPAGGTVHACPASPLDREEEECLLIKPHTLLAASHRVRVAPSCSRMRVGTPLQGGHGRSSQGQGLKRGRSRLRQAEDGRREEAIHGPLGNTVPNPLSS